MPRIAIAGFLHETNTFATDPTTYADFCKVAAFPGILRGAQMLENPRFPLATGGFVTAAKAKGWDLVPVLWCFAEPAGYVTADAFERVMAEIVHGIASNGPYDAVYLDLHGAMVTREYPDGEAEILRRVRAVIGPDMPLVNSLDLHGNVGPGMMAGADAMVAYRTYPHVDMRATGERAAVLIERLMANRKKLAKAYRRIPFLMPIHQQSTFMEPAKSIYAELERIEAADRQVASLSLLMGFPLADIEMCAPSVLAYGETQAAADKAADALVDFIMKRERAFVPGLKQPDEAVAAALASRGNRAVVLADVQDNAGAGGTADTVGLIEALVRAKAPDAVVAMVYDPESAAKAHAAGEGAEVTLDLGGKSVAGHKPMRAVFTVEKLADGPFPLTGPMGSGSTANLGKVAQLRIGGVRIVVTSGRTQCLDQAYFRHAGIEPAEHKLVVVKSTNHYRADFESIADAIIPVAAPSNYDVNPANLAWHNLPAGMRLYGNGPAVER